MSTSTPKPPVGATVQLDDWHRVVVTAHTERGFRYKGPPGGGVPRLGLSLTGEGEIYTDYEGYVPRFQIVSEPAPRSSTETLIIALRVLARDIQSEDGVANATIAEAADRLEELKDCAVWRKMAHDLDAKVLDEQRDHNKTMDKFIALKAEAKACQAHLNAAYEAAGLSRFSSELLSVRVAELAKDKARLDWFDKTFHANGETNPYQTGGTVYHIKFPGVHVATLRAAIDACMPSSK